MYEDINRFSFNSLQSTVEMAEKKETQQFTEMELMKWKFLEIHSQRIHGPGNKNLGMLQFQN